MQKFVKLFLLISLIFTLFVTACTEKSGNQTEGDINEKSGDTNNENKADDNNKTAELQKYDPPITITVDRYISSDKINKGEYWNNNPWAAWARDNLGIMYEAKWNAIDAADKKQKLQLAIASDDLPDVVTDLNPIMVQQMAEAGQLLPISDLINQYGSALTKRIFQEYDESVQGNGFKSVSYKGKYYAIPLVYDTFSVTSNTLFIRQDILDELGMKVPENLNEMEAVLKAYKAKFPKEIGYILEQNLDTASFIFSPYKAFPKNWLLDDSGNAVYGSIQPEVKQGLAKLRDWFKEGYFDKEYAVKDYWKAAPDFTSGNALTLSGPYWVYGWSFPVLNSEHPESKVVPVPLLKGTDGFQGQYVSFSAPWPTGITYKAKHPEALILELNEAFASLFRNEEDLREFINYPKTDPLKPNNPEEVNEKGMAVAKYDYPDDVVGPGFFKWGGPQTGGLAIATYTPRPNATFEKTPRIYEAVKNNALDTLTADDKAYYESIMTKEHMNYNEMSRDAHFLNVEQSRKNVQNGLVKFNVFAGPPTETMKTKSEYLTKLELETFNKIITGQAPLEDFDKFVEEWKKQGGDKITEEVNEWYKNNK